MNFQETAARFETSGAGSDDFKQLSKDVFQLMGSDSPNAALYFVIGVVAHSYVTRYEDQAVTGEFADRAKSILVRFNKKIIEAMASEPGKRLLLLGEVAAEYQLNVHEF